MVQRVLLGYFLVFIQAMQADKLGAYLARGINYFGSKVLTAVFDYLAESILNGGIVAVYKMVVDELHCQGGFTWHHHCP